MVTCTSCGHDVTGKKFCPDCGTPVQATQAEAATAICPRCGGSVRASAAFCMHCGASLGARALAAAASPPPAPHLCPACHSEVPPNSAFCTNCGQSTQAGQAPTPVATAPSFCGNCGVQNNPGARFCNSCGQALTTGAVPQTGPYQQPPQYGQPHTQAQYGQPYSQYPSQPYQQPQYGQQPYVAQPQYNTSGYQSQPMYQQPAPTPMMGQQPMVLRCPVCMAMAPMGTPNCPSCHTNLAGVVPTPAAAAQGQQQGGGLGNMLQGNAGKYAMGALGGAAAVLGGEMLLHGVENSLEGGGGWGDGYEHHHHRDEGLLGGLGNLSNDLGLF